MFNIVLCKFTKNENSTKRPGDGVDTVTLSCRVITPSSVIAPAVEISGTTDVKAYNYAYIAEFNRYYWITNIAYNNPNWVLSLKCDVLATYKNEIGASSLYILRSSEAYNGRVVDTYYPPLAQYTTASRYASLFGGTGLLSRGAYLINIIGTTTGTSTIYQLTPANFVKFINRLYVNIDGFQGSDIIDKVVQYFGGNPIDLINGIFWIPVPLPPLQGNTQNVPVKIGSWTVYDDDGTTPITGMLIGQQLYSWADAIEYINVPKHPQAASRGEYLNTAPYSKYTMNINGIGVFTLDATKMIDTANIGISVDVDALTCEMCVRVFDADGGRTLAQFAGMFGIPINIASRNNGGSIIGGIVSTGAAIAGAAITGGASLIAGAAAAGIGSLASAMEGMPTTSTTGNASILLSQVWLNAVFYNIPDEDNARNGRPLCEIRTPASLGGFMMVQRGDVEIDGTFAEMQEIKTFLESGFYYE